MRYQILICSLILLISIFIGMDKIGEAEYNKDFCYNKLTDSGKIILPSDNVALLENRIDPYTKREQEEGLNISYNFGCCLIPEGMTQIRKNQHCINTPSYKIPSINNKIMFFFKKF